MPQPPIVFVRRYVCVEEVVFGGAVPTAAPLPAAPSGLERALPAALRLALAAAVALLPVVAARLAAHAARRELAAGRGARALPPAQDWPA